MKKRLKNLTITFIQFSEIEKLDSNERIKKLLKIILANKLIVLQGKLHPEEETRLIQDTMAMIGVVKNFRGIELARIDPSSGHGVISKMRYGLAKAISGDFGGITIIGPATIVKEIKQDPSKVELFLK